MPIIWSAVSIAFEASWKERCASMSSTIASDMSTLERSRAPSSSVVACGARIGAPDAAVGDWTAVVRRAAERYAEWNRAAGMLAAPEIAAIRERLIGAAAGVAAEVSPAITHRDLYLANVLINGGRFAALLDFELAKGYDPLLDFVKLGGFVFERWPASLKPFMAAYRHGVGRAPRVEERLSVCLALEQFVALPNWVQLGEERLARDTRDRLRAWLRGSSPWWVTRIVAALG